MGTSGRKDLLSFSVQIFSTPSLVPLFIESGFLNQLYHRLEELFQRIMIHEESGAVRLKWSNAILRKNLYLPLFYDLRYIISLRDTSRYILFMDQKDMLQSMLELFGKLNDGLVHQRVPSSRNCLDDDENWSICWSLEDNLISLAGKLSKGLEIIEGHEVHTRHNCVMKLREILKQVISDVKKLNKTRKSTTESGVYRQVKFQVSRDKVSLSAPAFKLVEIFLDRAINKLQIPLAEIIEGMENDFVTYLVESPLRLRVLYAQVAAKMWVRNGLRFQWVVHLQEYSVRYYTHVPKDIFLLQCCAATMPHDRLFHLLQERFEISPAMHFHPRHSQCNPEWDVNQITTIVERFLSLLVILVTNRSKVGVMTAEEKIREFMMHLLFYAPSTHSELMNNAFNDYTKHPKLKQLISEVADFDTTPMQNGEPGKYLVKSEMWDKLDPYFVHYSPTEFQEVQEKYFAHRNKTNPSSQGKIIPVPIPAPLSPSFRNLLHILQSKYLHRILYWMLLYAAESNKVQCSTFTWRRTLNLNQQENGVYASVTTTHHALRLLYLACAMRETEDEVSEPQNITDCFASPADLPFQCDDIACNILQEFNIPSLNSSEDSPSTMTYSLLQMLGKIYEEQSALQDYIGTIFELLRPMDYKIAAAIDSMLKSNISQEEDEELASLRDSALRAKQAAKQKEVMEAFKQRQETFMRESAELFVDDDDFLDDDQPVCAVCKDSCTPTLDNPVGCVAYQQQTRLVQLHRAQHHGEALKKPIVSQSALRSDNFRFFEALRNISRLEAEEVPQPSAAQSESPSEEKPEDKEETEQSSGIPPIVWEETIRPSSSYDIQFCQHFMHISCFQTYYDTLIKQARRQFRFSLDIQANEFHCPICRKLSNVIVPLPPIELLDLTETIPQEESERENFDVSKLKPFTSTKNVYDTFTMNCSLVFDLKALKYYIPFHAAYDILFISALRSKIESIEFVSREELLPPISLLAENRSIVQQLYNSALGYKKCCQIDDNYDQKSVLSHIQCLQWLMDGEDTCTFAHGDENLMNCDIFSVLTSLVFYSPKIELEQFDDLVQILFAAQILQILLAFSHSKNEPSSKVFGFTSHPHLDELVSLISATCETQVPAESKASIFDEGLEFLRKVYILRHTLFDVFFSTLKDESSSMPFADLCDALICDPRRVTALPTYLRRWEKIGRDTNDPVRLNPAFAPFTFIKLPSDYSFAYDKKYTSQICDDCGDRPKNPALCLLCGQLVCAAAKCCTKARLGECNRHARECGGIGVFLLLNTTMVLLLQNGKGCLWDSLYVDEHGEVDEDLLRGKELYLSEIKLKELYSICVNQRVVMACNQKNENRRSVVFWENY